MFIFQLSNSNILYWVSNEQTLNFEYTSTNQCLLAQNCLLNPFRWCVLDIIINIKQNWITYENILFELRYSNRKLQMGTFIYIVCILGRLDNLWSSCKPVFSTTKCQRGFSNSNIFMNLNFQNLSLVIPSLIVGNPDWKGIL